MAHIRHFSEIEQRRKDGSLTPAEEKLIQACKAGQPCVLGGDVPEENCTDPKRTIHADILRYLILGGCADCPVAEYGVYVKAAIIIGKLDLDHCIAKGVTGLINCHIDHPITAMNGQFQALNLQGSHIQGLMAQGAIIKGSVFLKDGFHATGAVHLIGVKIGGQLACTDGQFDNPKDNSKDDEGQLKFPQSGLALHLQGAIIKGDVFLSNKFHATGAVDLVGAKIGGQLACDNGQFDNPTGHALNLQRAIIKGSVFLKDGFHATGAVHLIGVKIGGQLNCTKGQFDNPKDNSEDDEGQLKFPQSGLALHLQGAIIKDSVFLNDNFHATGTVDLNAAEIGGQLNCTKGQFDNPKDHALKAQGAIIKGHVFLRNGFHATGAIDLISAEIGGQLDCTAGQFDNPKDNSKDDEGQLKFPQSGLALHLQGAIIKGDVFLSNKFHATGAVDLVGAKIGGQLACDNGQFDNPTGHALNLQRAIIKGSVFLKDGFHATGAVDLISAEIGGQLDCTAGRFDNPKDNSEDDEGQLKFPQSGLALHLQGAIIKDSVFLNDNFHATGTVDLNGAEIGGQLSCIDGRFDNPEGHALNAQGAMIKDGFFWCKVTNVTGLIHLVNMHCDTLADDQASWRHNSMTYNLDGMTYNRIITMDFTHNLAVRLAWLQNGAIRKQSDHDTFTPQPYSQYANCMRKMGHDRTARKILLQREKMINRFAREDACRKQDTMLWKFLQGLYNFFPWATDFIQHWLIGYGHDLKRALIFTFLLWLCAIPFSHYAWQAGAITPNSAVILTSVDWLQYHDHPTPNIEWAEKSPIGQDWSSFNRYSWAADVVIPLVEFGQTDAWTPSQTNGGWGKTLWIAQWVFSFLGWVAVGMFVAGLTGITRRD